MALGQEPLVFHLCRVRLEGTGGTEDEKSSDDYFAAVQDGLQALRRGEDEPRGQADHSGGRQGDAAFLERESLLQPRLITKLALLLLTLS